MKAGGSPEANCILCVWTWNMLILHCVLQCFVLFSQIVRSVKVAISARINLTFVRAEKWQIYIFHGWPNMCATSKPLELRFHAFLVVLLTTRKCHNSLENHGRNEHHTFFMFTSTKAFWSSCLEREHHWSSHSAVAVTTASTKLHPPGFNNSQSNAPHMTLLHPPHPHIFNEATSSRFQQVSIQRSPHDVITPSPPPLFCKQQRYLQRNNIFNEATSSRFQQVSIQRSPHEVITPPPPPPTPHLYTITTFIVHDKTEGSWKLRGTPALTLNIYIAYPAYAKIDCHVIMMHFYRVFNCMNFNKWMEHVETRILAILQ